MAFPRVRILALLALIAVAILCATFGGPTNDVDIALVRDGMAMRAASALSTQAGLILNFVGGAPLTLALGAGGILLFWHRRQHRRAIAFGAIVLGGRLLVEGLKLFVQRPRPMFDLHPVLTHSLSFPSAHAANSMIVFPAVALFFVPAERRSGTLVAAVAASLLIGASRPLLGVHWPTDVLGGWAIGAAWLIAGWAITERLAPGEAQHDIVGGHRPAIVEE